MRKIIVAFFVFVLGSVILYGGKTDVIAFNQFIGDPVRIEVSGYFYDKTLDEGVSIKKVIKGGQVGGFKEICAKLDLEKNFEKEGWGILSKGCSDRCQKLF